MLGLKRFPFLIPSLLLVICTWSVARACVLTVATPDIPPHFWVDNGKAQGLTVDFFNLVAKQSGCEISYQAKPWKRVLHQLNTGGVDMTIGFYTQSREQFARYSNAKFGKYQFYIFAAGVKNQNLTVNSLYAQQKKLMYLKHWYLGTLKQQIIAEPSLAMPILSLDKGLKLMMANRADAILGPKMETLYSIKMNNLNDKVFLNSKPLLNLDQYVMFSKHSVSDEIYHRVNKAITEVVKSGETAQLAKKYSH